MSVTIKFSHLKKSPEIKVDEIDEIKIENLHTINGDEVWSLNIVLDNAITKIIQCRSEDEATSIRDTIWQFMQTGDYLVEIGFNKEEEKTKSLLDVFENDINTCCSFMPHNICR